MAITFTAAEQAVLIAIFEQINVSKIDKDKLREDLTVPTKDAANKRVTRLRKKLDSWARAREETTSTFTASEQGVLVAVFGQINTGKIDKEKLRGDLGLPTKDAAGKRVTRLREKINQGRGGAATTGVTTASSKKGKQAMKGSAKKRKLPDVNGVSDAGGDTVSETPTKKSKTGMEIEGDHESESEKEEFFATKEEVDGLAQYFSDEA